MATHYSILTWQIPWTEELGELESMGSKVLDMTEQLTHTLGIESLIYTRVGFSQKAVLGARG